MQRERAPHRRKSTMALCAAAALAAGAVAARADSPLYAASEPDVAGPPGSIIWREPLSEAAPEQASAIRVLYRDRPARRARRRLRRRRRSGGRRGRPIVAWQHPTSGVTQPCAPSLSPSVLHMIQGLPEMPRRGPYDRPARRRSSLHRPGAKGAAVDWISDRFAGLAAPSDCEAPTP